MNAEWAAIVIASIGVAASVWNTKKSRRKIYVALAILWLGLTVALSFFPSLRLLFTACITLGVLSPLTIYWRIRRAYLLREPH